MGPGLGRDLEVPEEEPERVEATYGVKATQLQAKEVGPFLTWLLGCQGPGGMHKEHLKARRG